MHFQCKHLGLGFDIDLLIRDWFNSFFFFLIKNQTVTKINRNYHSVDMHLLPIYLPTEILMSYKIIM